MENQDSTKENILRLSMSFFAQKGYEAVGVQEICTAANVTKPTLYYYFGSKKGLLENIISVNGNDFLTRLKEASFYNHDFIGSLKKILKCNIDFALENKTYFNLHTVLKNAPENCEEKEAFKELEENINSAYLEFFQLSVNEFGNMKGKEKLYATIFQSNCLSVTNEILKNNMENSEAFVSQIIQIFVYGIAN